MNREVALKEVQARHLESGDAVARFLREAEVTEHLEHPGVVPVYGLGTYPDGRPYYSMRLIRGENFQQAIDKFYKDKTKTPGEQAIAFRGLLRRFIDVCNAVGYSHSRGVIHRDLKPANVMLGPYGETLVIDWGLAKVVGEKTEAVSTSPTSDGKSTQQRVKLSAQASGGDETREGSSPGTPAFMSPEQALGQVAPGWALRATFIHLGPFCTWC